jgi:hypothetical protein
MDAVALGSDILQRPDLAVELGALLQVTHAKLDAAQSVGSGLVHGAISKVRGRARLATHQREQDIRSRLWRSGDCCVATSTRSEGQ